MQSQTNADLSIAVDLLLKKKWTNESLLTWLELFSSSLLDPGVKILDLPEGQFCQLQESMRECLVALQSFSYHQVLKSKSGKQNRKTALKFHQYFVALLNRITVNQTYFIEGSSGVVDCFRQVYQYLVDMIGWLEDRYPVIRKSENIPPAGYANETISQFGDLLASIRNKCMEIPDWEVPIRLIEEVCILESRQQVPESLFTYKDLAYKREFLEELSQLNTATNYVICLNSLDLFLISHNFNHRLFAEYLIGKIQGCTVSSETVQEKIAKIDAIQKEVVQVCIQKRHRFDERLESLEQVITRCLEEKILHLDSLKNADASITSDSTPILKPSPVKCNLSIDQLALIFRAADEEKVIESKSLSAIFRTIAPLISTAHKQCISADSMRSKCYNAEARDIKNTIEVLEKIIGKIKDY